MHQLLHCVVSMLRFPHQFPRSLPGSFPTVGFWAWKILTTLVCPTSRLRRCQKRTWAHVFNNLCIAMYNYIYVCVIAIFLAILLLNKDHKTKNAMRTHILHKDAGHGTPNPKFCKRLSFAFPANTFWTNVLMRDVSSHHASTNSCPSQCCVALPGLWQHQVASSLRVACKHQWSAENNSAGGCVISILY